jgi:hypothetical protein
VSETPIEVLYPTDGEVRELRVRVSACRLTLTPGDDTAWVRGRYRDPSSRIPLHVEVVDGVASLRQAASAGDWVGVMSGVPTLELAVGTGRPTALRVEAGASDVDVEVGGVPLTGLTLRTGAGRCRLRFARPNPQEMGELVLGVGAGSTEATGLANARAAELRVDGGASDCTLKVDGEPLARDTRLVVTTGMAAVDLEVPASTATTVRAESTLGRRELPPGWEREGERSRNTAAIEGRTPVLDVHASVALGSLRIRERP